MLNKKFIATLTATATLMSGVVFAVAPATAYADEATSTQTTDEDNQPIKFKDPVLKQAILDSLKENKKIDADAKDITLNEAKKVKYISLSNFGHEVNAKRYGVIHDTSDLRYFSNLVNLELTDLVSVADLEHLSYCKKLSYVKIDVDDTVTSLPKLPHLQSLNIKGKNITDLSPLRDYRIIESLDINSDKVSDLSPLHNLPILEMLVLSGNNITDLSPLHNLPSLKMLKLSGNNITDLSPLSGNHSLSYIHLKSKNLSDLSKLTDLPELSGLDIEDSKVTDLSPLVSLKSLRGIRVINDNSLSDLSPLSKMNQLVTLALSGDEISDFSPLSNLTNLFSLDLNYSYEDISNVDNYFLRKHIEKNKISDLSFLSNLTNLDSISLSISSTDLSPLSHLTNLRTLILFDSQVLDMSTLSNLPKLGCLNIYDSTISDLSSFSGSKTLGSLFLSNVTVKNSAPLKDSNNLYVVCTHIPDLNMLNIFTDESSYVDRSDFRVFDVSDAKVGDLAPVKKLGPAILTFNYDQANSPAMSGFESLVDVMVSPRQVPSVSFLSRFPNLGALVVNSNASSDEVAELKKSFPNLSLSYMAEDDQVLPDTPIDHRPPVKPSVDPEVDPSVDPGVDFDFDDFNFDDIDLSDLDLSDMPDVSDDSDTPDVSGVSDTDDFSVDDFDFDDIDLSDLDLDDLDLGDFGVDDSEAAPAEPADSAKTEAAPVSSENSDAKSNAEAAPAAQADVAAPAIAE
ncbi:leucine-rich repeat domain-containing protein [Gardnerella sp. Marseille-Q2328]|uniref:leucine-rich repeat domain-containing protein n=1 Tax=Gardnerella sp. Marseille-Q2328 TaxID=2759694 RepID=UPI002024B80D|nr:leucine-rich repeat domain-containing protein [Gardnerella sp. Marseille-Q2328]